ncbi:alpha/beta hydrolase [Mucilaginibacter sp. cycad4]|uniref:alpha/beta fold hydrolase n=1 Tax=Mucilaginibacter sp. cycad4 TaxID=3342096 RepID=UPI002AAA9A08|nr:alpha/beta hydrolase [Mucilaginibacter gossypii]WPV02124.1 alpha/beta hydrolase [Mucilaginibacter gossypii]
MDKHQFEQQRKFALTPSGKIAYIERGTGPVSLFVHGLIVNGYLWRHQLEDLSTIRRCIAIDLLAHGSTEITPEQDVSFEAQAEMLKQFLDALHIDQIDLVANDSGVGISLIFAARYPEKLRSLTLTNGDVHDNWPPVNFSGFLDMVKAGGLANTFHKMITDPDYYRSENGFAGAYEDPQAVSDNTVAAYITPLQTTPQRIKNMERFIMAFDNNQTVRIEDDLKKLNVPTLIIWGTGDPFFGVEWSKWLEKTIPGHEKRVELESAKMLFPEERPDELTLELRKFWAPNK